MDLPGRALRNGNQLTRIHKIPHPERLLEGPAPEFGVDGQGDLPRSCRVLADVAFLKSEMREENKSGSNSNEIDGTATPAVLPDLCHGLPQAA